MFLCVYEREDLLEIAQTEHFYCPSLVTRSFDFSFLLREKIFPSGNCQLLPAEVSDDRMGHPRKSGEPAGKGEINEPLRNRFQKR